MMIPVNCLCCKLVYIANLRVMEYFCIQHFIIFLLGRNDYPWGTHAPTCDILLIFHNWGYVRPIVHKVWTIRKRPAQIWKLLLFGSSSVKNEDLCWCFFVFEKQNKKYLLWIKDIFFVVVNCANALCSVLTAWQPGKWLNEFWTFGLKKCSDISSLHDASNANDAVQPTLTAYVLLACR